MRVLCYQVQSNHFHKLFQFVVRLFSHPFLGLAPALRHVSLRIEGGERVGIVGPSGAGKSSLVVLLSRLLNPSTGRVCIDGIDTRDLGILTLRQAMAIIPQTPLLLGASVRKNLDPFNEHSTEALQDALCAVGLSTGLLDDTKAKPGQS